MGADAKHADLEPGHLHLDGPGVSTNSRVSTNRGDNVLRETISETATHGKGTHIPALNLPTHFAQ